MKRILLYSFIVLFSLPFLVACFDDKSTEADHIIPEIVIDTVGLNLGEAIYVKQYETLELAPKIFQEGLDGTNLSYKWVVSMQQYSVGAELIWITLGTESALNAEIINDSSPNAYRLWLQVTDENTGIRKDMVWQLYVQNAYTEGLVVASTNDGRTTDISLVQGEDFTVNWKEGETPTIQHELYSYSNDGEKIDGLVTGIVANETQKTGLGTFKHFCLIGDDFFMEMDKGYKFLGKNLDVSYDKASIFSPTQIALCNGTYVLVNNGGIGTVEFTENSNIAYTNIQFPSEFSWIQNGGVVANASVDKYIAYRTASKYRTSDWKYCPWGIWYSAEHGVFLTQNTGGPNRKSGMNILNTIEGAAFDPNNCPNLEVVYAHCGYYGDDSNCLYFIMKNKNSNKYEVYIFKGNDDLDWVAEAVYEIDGNEIDQATGFVVSEKYSVIYFTTKNDLYAIVIDPLKAGQPLTSTIRYTFSEEITHFSVFQQFDYLKNPNYNNYLPEVTDYLLLVGVWDGSKGTLKTIPIANVADGTLSTNTIKSYEGFGKILAVTHQPE